MNVTFRCPQCDRPAREEFTPESAQISCPHCGARLPIGAGAVTPETVVRCLICPSTELFVRKDFPQILGVLIVTLAAVISSIFWYYHAPIWTYATLFAAAAIDLLLYIFVGNQLQCYRCQAQYRGLVDLERQEPFDLETHERHRQQAARLAQSQPKR